MNRNIGDRYESALIDLLNDRGFWCHLFAYKPEGQPCDVVALKGNSKVGLLAMLIDVKHCSEDRFSFSNIRPNQRSCFLLAQQRGIEHCGFAIYFEKQHCWRWLPFEDVVNLESWGYKSVPFNQTEDFLWN